MVEVGKTVDLVDVVVGRILVLTDLYLLQLVLLWIRCRRPAGVRSKMTDDEAGEDAN